MSWEIYDFVRLCYFVGSLIVDKDSCRSGALEEPIEYGLVLGVTEKLLKEKDELN